MVSAVTGEWLAGRSWTRRTGTPSLRETVRFAGAVRALADGGHGVFVEVVPAPGADRAAIGRDPGRDGAAAVVTGTLRRDDGGPAGCWPRCAEAHVRGVGGGLGRGAAGRGSAVDLPTYAFQRQRYWPRARGRRHCRPRPVLGAVTMTTGLAGAWRSTGVSRGLPALPMARPRRALAGDVARCGGDRRQAPAPGRWLAGRPPGAGGPRVRRTVVGAGRAEAAVGPPRRWPGSAWPWPPDGAAGCRRGVAAGAGRDAAARVPGGRRRGLAGTLDLVQALGDRA